MSRTKEKMETIYFLKNAQIVPNGYIMMMKMRNITMILKNLEDVKQEKKNLPL